MSIYDSIGAFGISAERFVNDLKQIKAKTIHVRLNTPGGEVTEATAIYNALREHPARIVTHVDGIAASAGSFIAVAGDSVEIADNAYLMIHNAQGGVMGEATDMRTYADVLDKMNGNIAGMYTRKSGKPADHWRQLMTAETWFTAQEAKDQGLADVVVTPTKKAAVRMGPFDLKIYNHVPPDVMKRFATPPQFPAALAKSMTVTFETDKPVDFSKLALFENSNDSPAPEAPASPIVSEPPPSATPTTEPHMADNPTVVTTAPPAQPPVAAPAANPQQGEVARLTDTAIQTFIARGKSLGYAEGRAMMMNEFREIVSACPNRPQTAINAFLGGQNAQTVKLIVEAEQNAEIAANKRNEGQEIEILRLRAEQARLMELNAIGGHPGVPQANVYAPAANAGTELREGLEPEAQAKLEWDSDPILRAKHNNKERNYILFRTNQLKGNVRILSRTA